MGTEKKIGVLFPGQASQYVGMGRDFMEAGPGCREMMETGERITGLPLKNLCLNGPLEQLTQTGICQPAVFAVSLLCWLVFREKTGINPAAMAGHSLGEYTALTAAGCFSAEDGFRIVRTRAAAMEEISGRIDGSMLAVLGQSAGETRSLISSFPGVEISNINAPGQTVVGGIKTDLEKFETFLREQKIKAVWLKVSGPFHTRHMKEAANALGKELRSHPAGEPACPVYANCSAAPVAGATGIVPSLLLQMTSPVRWVETIQNMAADGIETFVEIGPKNVLKGLVGKIAPEIPVFNVEDNKTLEEFLCSREKLL